MFRIFFVLLISLSLIAKENLVMFGPQVAYLRVREDSLGHDENLDGPVGGGKAFYQYKKWEALYTCVYTSWLYGQVAKDNVICRTILDGDAEGRFGYNYTGLQSKDLTVTPYIGFGFHYSDEKLDSIVQHDRYFYFVYYMPVGLILDWAFADWFHWQFHFQWRPDIDPTVKQRGMSKIRYVMNKKENQFFVEMPFSFRTGEKRVWDLSVVPFWKLTKHGRSLVSPDIRYTFWGLSFLAGYHF
jgi:hypothetical protein